MAFLDYLLLKTIHWTSISPVLLHLIERCVYFNENDFVRLHFDQCYGFFVICFPLYMICNEVVSLIVHTSALGERKNILSSVTVTLNDGLISRTEKRVQVYYFCWIKWISLQTKHDAKSISCTVQIRDRSM